MKIVLILNRDAGTLRGLDADAVGDEIAAIFRARGHEVSLDIAAGKDAVAAIEASCKASSAEAVVVGGGDGTVSAAAGAAAEAGIALGILPLGTMNFFARSLTIPTGMEEAAAALAEGEVDEVDIARINGRWFIHSIALGLHPAMVAEREKFNYGSRYGKMIGSLRAFLRVVRNPRRFHVTIETDGATLRRRTAGIVVSNNPLGEGHMPYADRLDDGVLAVYVTTARGWLQLTRVVAASALGTTAVHPLIEVCETRAAEITTGARLVPVTVDGELLSLAGPLKVESIPRGLKVLRPRQVAGSV